ncbi:hypothetical protein JZO81_19560 [Enterococcus hulanensis]|uniref:hypothetical protein n=1 Tax=Enterococcus TaxID=1350 RepID=UPI000B5A3C66|nr:MULTISPECIES: hypothetical protein [Enterococcus]MBO0413257.1 hypothetical protein [Enterococcus hulanensis]OTO15427.1 hypothetical protein A5875_004585 [Enterococcus sp. 3H8_DIV0648]
MKKKWTRSLLVAIGASIFLYSEDVFANTAIYDPLDPQNTITPIPNEEHDMSDYLVENDSTTQSAESNSSEESKSEVTMQNKEEDDAQNDPAQSEGQPANLLPKNGLKQADKDDDFSIPNPYLPKFKEHPKNQVLMLDDEFFFSQNTTILPPDSGGGSGGAPNDFADIAQSAYLLSGVVLYGKSNGNLTSRVSEHFA